LLVDYNGMLRSLRAALAEYALGGSGNDVDVATPIAEQVVALADALHETEAHLKRLGFDAKKLHGAKGFARIEALAEAVDAVYTDDESKRRFEILARQVFSRFKALTKEPSVYAYAERHDNIEAIYKKLTENRDTADVTDLLKELHRIVNAAIQAQTAGQDQRKALIYDLSRIDLEALRNEFAAGPHRATVLQDVRQVVERKLANMLAQNPLRMDYYRKYQEIVADYNREKDRTAIESTFAALASLIANLDAEQMRAAQEGLSEDELAVFDLIQSEVLTKAERERVKQASRELLVSLRAVLATMERWTEKEQTQAEVQMAVLDSLYRDLPTPPFSEKDKEEAAEKVYRHIWSRSRGADLGAGAVGVS
jgi:type I restriction enzyme R subunit